MGDGMTAGQQVAHDGPVFGRQIQAGARAACAHWDNLSANERNLRVCVEKGNLFGQSRWERDIVGIEASDVFCSAMLEAMVDRGRDAGVFLMHDQETLVFDCR